MIRWKALVVYRSDNGPVDVVHDLQELHEIHDLIERGPHWGTIVSIVIVYVGVETGITLEDAERA